MKITESVEQKRTRRLAKKLAKDRKRKEEMGWDEEMMVSKKITASVFGYNLEMVSVNFKSCQLAAFKPKLWRQ